MPELPDPLPVVSERTHRVYGGWGVLCVAVLIRVWAVWNTDVIQRDGVGFISFARQLAENPVAAMRARDQHPLYPLIVLGVHRVMEGLGVRESPQSWAWAGQGVSVLGGCAATMAVWALAGMCMGWRTAWVAGGLFAVGRKWVSLGADVMSDSLALALMGWGLVLGGMCVRRIGADRGGGGYAAGAGVLAGLAYLARPEGMGAVLVLGMVLGGLAIARRVRWQRAAAGLGLAAVCAAAVASPYMQVIGGVTKKKPVETLVTFDGGGTVGSALAAITPMLAAYGPASERTALGALVGQTAEGVHPILFALACAYAAICVYHFSLPREKRRSYLPVPEFPVSWMLVGTAGLYAVVAVRLHMTAGYLDWRHCMAIAFVLAVLAGAAVVALFDFAACFLAGSLGTTRPVPEYIRLHWMWMFPALLVGVGAMSVGPLHGGQYYIVRAAEAAREDMGTRGGFMVSNLGQVLFYTDRPGMFLDTQRIAGSQAAEELAQMKPKLTHVALSERWLGEGRKELTDQLEGSGYRLIGKFQASGDTRDTIRLYRVVPDTEPVRAGIGAADR